MGGTISSQQISVTRASLGGMAEDSPATWVAEAGQAEQLDDLGRELGDWAATGTG